MGCSMMKLMCTTILFSTFGDNGTGVPSNSGDCCSGQPDLTLNRPARLPPGIRRTQVGILARREWRATRNRLGTILFAVRAITASSCWGQPVVQAVLNGASYSGNVAPGTCVAIFGSQLSPSTATAKSVPLLTKLNGVSVTIAGIAAPLFYVSPTQINALLPFEVAAPQTTLTTVPVVVTTPAGSSAPLNLLLSRHSPGLFTQNGAGTGRALLFDANFKPVALLGSGAIVLYADGLG